MDYLLADAFASWCDNVSHFFGTRLTPARWLAEWRIGVVSRGPDEWPTVVSVKQVHGTDALVVDRAVEIGETFPGGWDAIITNQPKVLVTVRTADCVPVLIHDPKRRVVAAIHAGWRGAVNGIIPKTVATMRESMGCEPSDLTVAVGPSAGPCCYEVDEPVLGPLRERVGDWERCVHAVGPKTAYLNLKELVQRQAIAAGVTGEHIARVDRCTMCESEMFYSYRREGDQRGTMISGIMLADS